MSETRNNQKKGFLTEEDMSTILQRYTASTILELLREVAHSSTGKIDWNSLVQKTTTGISNAREYQLLWRHLAYRHNLVERLPDGAQPADDDSDIEFELEASPSVNAEASTEAATCVKVLIGSNLTNESTISNNAAVEAPLSINVLNGQSSKAPVDNAPTTSSKHGTNVTVPVSMQKQSLAAATSGEGAEINGLTSSIYPNRRKRKPWSEEEDLELIAAVKKCGEGNWANIVKGDFKGGRTASQLAQRWAIIRKRNGNNLNIGANCNGTQLSEAQLATRRAIDMALKDNLTASCAGNGTMAGASNPGTLSQINEDSPVTNNISQSQHTQHQAINHTSKSAAMILSAKPRPPPKKMIAKASISPDSMVKAAAVAAGARIASPSDAATLFKAAQAKNAVHIMPVGGGGPLIKPTVAGSGNPLPSAHLPGHPNVHYFRTSLGASTNPPTAAGSNQMRGSMVRPGAPLASLPQSAKAATAAATPCLPLQQTATMPSTPSTENQVKQEGKLVEIVPNSNIRTNVIQNSLPSTDVGAVTQNLMATTSQTYQRTEKAEYGSVAMEVVKNEDVNDTVDGAIKRRSQQSINRRPEVVQNSQGNGGVGKLEVSGEVVAVVAMVKEEKVQ